MRKPLTVLAWRTAARTASLELQPGEHVYPYDCDPAFALNCQNDKSKIRK